MHFWSIRRCSTYALKTVSALSQSVHPLRNVRLQGWSRKVQRKSKYLFLHVSDGLSIETVQVVVPRTVCSTVNVGSAVDVRGDWVPSEGRLQNMELLASTCDVVGPSNNLVVEDEASLLRQFPHLRPKSPAFSSLLQLRSMITTYCHQFFLSEGYVHIDTPVLSLNDCEGAGEAFLVQAQQDKDFFGHPDVFLPVSSQLHLEAIASSIPRVYTIGAAFRAEKSLSRSHLAEFRMVEAEFGFVESLEELCLLVERFLSFIISSLNNDQRFPAMFDLVSSMFGSKESESTPLVRCTEKSWPRLRYDEAVDILRSRGETVSAAGFAKQHELALVRHCQSPVFVTEYPAAQKPFYMKRDDRDQHAECFDLLSPFVGELAGGSLRETDGEKLRARGCTALLDWYVDLRGKGQPPTAGFGVGVERLVQSLFGIPHIRDTVAFPRFFKQCRC